MSTPDESETRDITDKAATFLRRYCKEDVNRLAQHYPNERDSLVVDYGDLFQYDPDLAEDFLDKPDAVTGYLEKALQKFDLPSGVELDGATVRVAGVERFREYAVGAYRSEQVGEYLAVYGQVSKSSPVQPRPLLLSFECQRCGTVIGIEQNGPGRTDPEECNGCERKGPWTIREGLSEFVDHQLLRVQEPPEETKGGRGEFVDVHLEGDLVTAAQPGDRVHVNGILEIEPPGQNETTFTPYIGGKAVAVEETDYDEIDVASHRERIERIAAGEEGDPFELLVDSIAPKIRGHDMIKEAIVLQLFGGVRVVHPNGDVDRGDSHILLLGDPGTAKSSLLRAIEEIAPRSAYASGKGTTAAGMTASAVRDDFGQEKWSLEAGALVIANKGIACVDEIDKVGEETVSSLHDALESQRVNVNKAGINATLPARTAVLAAGNPKYGRFDSYEPIADQIDISPTLMSRFDLMFMLSDDPDEDRDRVIADHMIESRRLANKHTTEPGSLTDEEREVIDPPIDAEVLRAYIAHAKQTVDPRVRDESVKRELRERHVDLRTANDDGDGPVPVTMRKLEAVQRLAEASARVRLSETVTPADVERAHRLVFASMEAVGLDPDSGDFDVDIVEVGESKSQRDRRSVIGRFIRELEDSETGAPHDTLMELMELEGFDSTAVEHDLMKMSKDGNIYEPSEGHYRWVRRR